METEQGNENPEIPTAQVENPTTEIQLQSGTLILKHEMTYGDLLVSVLLLSILTFQVISWLHRLILGRFHGRNR